MIMHLVMNCKSSLTCSVNVTVSQSTSKASSDTSPEYYSADVGYSRMEIRSMDVQQ